VGVEVTSPAATAAAAGGAEGLTFDIETITFSDDGRYTATTTGPQRTTSTGRYRFRMGSLTLAPGGHEPVTYGASVRAEQLRLTRRVDDRRLAATLTKQAP